MALKNIKAFMIDLDGVVFIGDEPVEGAVETVNFLMKKYRCLFATNTTRTTGKNIAGKLRKLGVHAKDEDVLTALSVAVDYIKSFRKPCYVIGSEETKNEFLRNGLKPDDKNPGFVVVGYDKNLTYDVLNKTFRFVMGGAKLVAMNMDRFAPFEDGLVISVGAFVKALEYATGKNAVAIGKPDEKFFRAALGILKSKPEETAIIGDSIENDIAGAQRIGIKGILVKNKYFKEGNMKEKPYLVLDSIKELKTLA